MKTIIYPFKDLAQSKAFYGKVHEQPMMDEAYHVQFKTAGREIDLDPNGHGDEMNGPVV